MNQRKWGQGFVIHTRLPLKGCPFCGAESDSVKEMHDKDSTGVMVCFIQCARCGNRTDGYPTTDPAYKAWNRRAGDR